MGPRAKNIGDLGVYLGVYLGVNLGVGLGDWDWDRREALFFFFSRFSGGRRQAQSEGGGARHGQAATGGGAEKNNAYPYIIDCSIPPPDTPLNDATNYSGSSKRSNCQ